MEGIARLGSALGGGVKMAIDLARMAVGLPPMAVTVADSIALAASRSDEPVGNENEALFGELGARTPGFHFHGRLFDDWLEEMRPTEADDL